MTGFPTTHITPGFQVRAAAAADAGSGGIGGGVSVKRSCTGANTDFINMLAHDRLMSKRISKMESVQS